MLPAGGFVLRGKCGSWTVRRGETIALAHVAVHREASLWGEAPAEYAPRRPQWDADAASDEYTFTTFSQASPARQDRHCAR